MTKKKEPTFSVLMSVYKNDNPEHLKLALESIYEKQTKKPDEIVIVFDGPLTREQLGVLDEFRRNKKNIVNYYPQKENKGLGEALRIGTERCKCDYIFRMDSDDISAPMRFEIQSKYIEKHKNIDVLGTSIAEFINSPEENNKKIRVCPKKQRDIIQWAKKRNPMNHMTVCIKRKSLIEAGGYKTLKYMEDYYLWIRMISHGFILENINKPLVYARIGNGFIERRNSKAQIDGWKVINDYMLQRKMITKKESIINTVSRNIFIFLPGFAKKIIYGKFLRKNG